MLTFAQRFIRPLIAGVLLALTAFAAQAQTPPLTTQQVVTLRADILADATLAPKCQAPSGDNPYAIADAYNQAAAPAWVIWKASVTTLDIGRVVNYVAVAALTTANLDRVSTFYTMNPSSFDPSRSDIRAYLSDTFSGALGGQGQATRDALDALYRRNATRFEKLFATGTGSTASPATMATQGPLSVATVQQACPGG